MISKECKITVSGNTASIDSEIYLYKNDMNIKYLFNIVNGDYAYTKDSNLDNIINANKASYAQIKFKKEDIEIDFDVQETSNGKVILLIKKELIDEDTELGDYTIQIRLFDESKTSVITLPPVNNCIHIMRPIFEKVDGSTNVVDEAAVDEAIVTYSEPMEAIASDGTFAKKTWVAKEKITTAELNRMEEGIAYNNSQYKDIANNQPTDLSLDSATNLLQLVNSKGSKLGNGITLPISSGGGTSQYLHIKYSSTGAPQLAGQISDTPNAYIGLCVDTNADSPTNPKNYTWYNWKGDNGDTGATPNLQIGTVTTLESGSNATASITGTTENPLLNLGIPKGDTGGAIVETWEELTISNTTLTLTEKKNQIVSNMVDGTEILLPSISGSRPLELHLFFNITKDLTLILPSCKWQNGNTPTISANKTYEFIFTYTTEWLGGVIAYE